MVWGHCVLPCAWRDRCALWGMGWSGPEDTVSWGGGCAAVGVSPPRDVLGTPTGVLVALGLWALTSPWP